MTWGMKQVRLIKTSHENKDHINFHIEKIIIIIIVVNIIAQSVSIYEENQRQYKNCINSKY